MVPRGGAKLFPVFRTLACPTFVKRSIASQWLFFRLSHPASAAGADFNDEEAGDN